MPDLEHIQAKFRKKGKDGDDSLSSDGSLAKNDEKDGRSLAEFETEEFPADQSSARSSLNLDSISTSSSQDASNSTQATPSEQHTIPAIYVQDPESKTTTAADEKPPRTKPETPPATATPEGGDGGTVSKQTEDIDSGDLLTKFNAFYYRNPMFFWLLVVIAIVPIAILIQVTIFRS